MSVLENKYVLTILSVLIVLYGSDVGPKLPKNIENLFKNDIVRVMVFAFIAYNGNKNPKISLLIAIGFLIMMNNISKREIDEGFKILTNIEG